MRPALILAPLLLAAAAAQAEPLMVTKGQWSFTQDIYYDATASGQPIDLPPEHSTIDECWSLDEEVLIDESMVEMFEGCQSTGAATESCMCSTSLPSWASRWRGPHHWTRWRSSR